MSADFVEKLRRSPTGHSQRDFMAGLEYHGYVLQRYARHGAIYRHPELAAHPDPDVRRRLAFVMIPKGNQLPAYVARDVLSSVEALERWKEERAR